MGKEFSTIRELPKLIGQPVRLRGWVYSKRSSGKVKFLMFRDGTGIVQAVFVKGVVSDETFENFEKLTQESSMVLTGKVREDKRSKSGVEVDADSLQILQIANDYPIGPKEHGPDFLLSNRHLWLRSNRPYAILTIRARFIKAVRDFFDQNGFT